ncbi:MAG: hypothetical protein D5S00_00380 [Tindallia sp. MSAO_Bac2]|nr:MAG: hypothetical protein D5S00_00380 [Tindallia sp. MSAO_Bac2]
MSEKWIRQKWLPVILIPIILFIVFNTWYSLPKLESSMMQEKQNQIQDKTRIGVSILEHFYSMESEGMLSRDAAQSQAKQLIRSLRFGPHNKDYFWINTHESVLVVHPFRPDLEGIDLMAENEEEVYQLFSKFVNLVETEGEGFSEYRWQYYDEENREEPKISFVTGFEPWDWIIGTGLYTDDIESTVEAQRNINFIFIITAMQLFLVAWVIYRLFINKYKKKQ